MSAVAVGIARLPGSDPAVPLPAYATAGAAGMDIAANLPAEAREGGIVLAPGARALVPTGLALALPPGYEMQLRPRSGLALREGIALVNAPGTIDADYRGEVGVIVINHGRAPVTIAHGMRIAQMVLAPVTRAAWAEVAAPGALGATGRGAGGFGSTGTGPRGEA